MLDDADDLTLIKKIIYAHNIDVTHKDGATLIGKLPGGPQRYLHKLFVPGDGILSDVEDIIEFSVPPSYAELFSLSDGATLFDNTLFLYGVGSATTREATIENIKPISLAENVEIQRKTDSNLEWIEVGSVAAATKNFPMQINKLGCVRLSDPDGSKREYSTFMPMLCALMLILKSNSNAHGLIDDSGEKLQLEIESYISSSMQ